MTIAERLKSERGATQLRFTDALVTAILLAVLLFIAYLQFATYHTTPQVQSNAAQIAH